MDKRVASMIANAHLDPVWMWNWPDGVDEAGATGRTAPDGGSLKLGEVRS